jgi:AbrB family looped-hinge helix DNA binding protein
MVKPRKTTLIVSQRGQITLPADVRNRLGIKEGGVVTLEEGAGELILRPAAVLEIEMYSEEDIERWDNEDQLSKAERRRIKGKLARKH